MSQVNDIFVSHGRVSIQIGKLDLFTEDPAEFAARTTVPREVLDQLSLFRRSHVDAQAYSLSHVLLGRNLDGSTIGLAYLLQNGGCVTVLLFRRCVLHTMDQLCLRR